MFNNIGLKKNYKNDFTSNKEYKSKYYKYKVKYLNLKDQLAGSSRTNQKILMDEVYNDTKCIILGNKEEEEQEERRPIFDRLKEIFTEHEICYNFFELSLFYQDWFQIIDDIVDDKRIIRFLKEDNTTSTSTLLFNRIEDTLKETIKSYYPPESIEFIDIDVTDTLEKGGNFIAIPKNNKYLTLSSDTTTGSCRFLPGRICLNLYNPNIKGHVDEILCFMPYTDELFKLWFYKPVFNEEVPEEIRTMITTRYLTNKEILNTKFPDLEIIEFDLEFSSTGSILNPPLFNRLCIKKGDKYIFIFPDQYNESIKSKITKEITQIRQYYTNTFFNYIDSSVTHKASGFNGVIGGNLHCLTKQFV